MTTVEVAGGMSRRSCLVVPGSSRRMLEKAVGVRADELVIDLEDAVPSSAKREALNLVLSSTDLLMRFPGSLAVRVNPPGSEWCHEEIEALAPNDAVTSLVLPKVESPGDLAFADRLLGGIEARTPRNHPLRLQALIESAASLVNLKEIATASVRLDALILGYADLASSLGRSTAAAEDEGVWSGPQERLLLVARANGLQAVDGPFFSFRDEAALRRSSSRTAAAGFDGKWAIHPAQVPTINEVFTPSADEIRHARAILDALRVGADTASVGAVALDGKMVDEAMAAAARRLLMRTGFDG